MENPLQWCDVCVICALPEEAEAFLEMVAKYYKVPYDRMVYNHSKYAYWRATLENEERKQLTLHITFPSRYGPNEMVSFLTRLLDENHPRIVIMTGICAGDPGQVHLGDLVIAERTFTYDSGKYIQGEHGEKLHLHDTITYVLDENIHQFLGIFNTWKPLVARLKLPPSPLEQQEQSPKRKRKIARHLKAMASGTAVRADNPFDDVRIPVRNAVAIDMEGAAVGLVMKKHPLVPWLIVKGVCDFADPKKADGFHTYAAQASALYALSFIRAYVTHERLPRSNESSRRDGLSSVWNVPFPRNPFFRGRDHELEHLHIYLQRSQPQVVAGLGGIGKTQIVIEYAYRFYQDYQAVFWVRADSVETLNTSYSEITSLLNLPERNAQGQEVITQAVKTWLQTHQGWLLILDNADEPDHFVPFLPILRGGHLLVTTRTADLTYLGLGFAHSLDVEPFSPEQGALFLLHRAELLTLDAKLSQATLQDQTMARQISQELGSLPLALDQAGAYLKMTRSDLATYQEVYRLHSGPLLKERRGRDHPESVATTWSISFEKVEQKNPAAADLLRFCAFLHPDAISEEIILIGAEHLGHLAPIARDPFALNKVFEVLNDYSLIHREPTHKVLSIHRLVQVVLKDAMDEPTRRLWVERTVRAVNRMFLFLHEEGVTATRQLYEQYLPMKRLFTPAFVLKIMATPQYYEQCLLHAQACAELMEQENLPLLEGATLLRYANLPEQSLSVYEQYEQHSGPEHYLDILSGKGHCYLSLGHFFQAIDAFTQYLEIEEAHHNKWASVSYQRLLGYTYQRLGQFDTALSFYNQSIATYKLLDNQPAYADVLSSMGNVYRLRGNLEEALRRCKIAEHIHEYLFKAGRISEIRVGLTLSTLGLLYLDAGDLIKAEEYFQRAYKIYERAGHKENIASTKNSFGEIEMAKGELGKAKEWFEDAERSSAGIDFETHANSLNKQGRVLAIQGRWSEAIGFFERAIEVARKVHGDYQWTESLIDLAEALTYGKQYEQAQTLLQDAEVISKRWNYFHFLGRIARVQGDTNYLAERYEEAFLHYAESCYHMARRNHIEFRTALRHLLDSLMGIPKARLDAIIPMLIQYWNTRQMGEDYLEFVSECQEFVQFLNGGQVGTDSSGNGKSSKGMTDAEAQKPQSLDENTHSQ